MSELLQALNILSRIGVTGFLLLIAYEVHLALRKGLRDPVLFRLRDVLIGAGVVVGWFSLAALEERYTFMPSVRLWTISIDFIFIPYGIFTWILWRFWRALHRSVNQV